MSLRDYEYFIAVAEEGHFSKAAARCHVSQPTLSVQLKKLEERLGVALFERHPRQVLLTFAGEVVLAKARQMLRLNNEISQLAQAAQNPLVGSFKLGIIPTIAPYLLPHFMPFQQQNAPELKPILQEAQTQNLLKQLREGTLDAALLALPLNDIDDLAVTALYAEPFYLALPENHPLAHQEAITTQDLQERELLLLEEGHCLRDHALEACEFLGKAENIELKATSLETVRYMVMSGQGVTLLPSLALKNTKGVFTWPHLVIKPLQTSKNTQPQRKVGLVCRYGYPRGQIFQKLFKTFATELAQKEPGVLVVD